MGVSTRGPRSYLRRTGGRHYGVATKARVICLLIVLAVAMLLLGGCAKIIGYNIPTNTEAGTHYVMTLRLQPASNQTGDGRGTVSFRIPNQWTVLSVTYSGARSGTVTYDTTMTNYFTYEWSAKPVDSTHNGTKTGYKWWSGYSNGNMKGLLATQWVDVRMEVNPHGYFGNFSLDFVTGGTSYSTPNYAPNNQDGLWWESGQVMLNRAVKLLAPAPPFVVSTSPPAGSVNVAVGVSPTVTFNENMDPNSLGGNVFVRKGSTTIAAVGSYNPASKTYTVNPNSDLDPSTVYQIVVKQAVKDTAGNTMAADYVVGFTTAPPAPVAPQVIQKAPAPGATGVSVGTLITATFNQDMDVTTVTDAAFYIGATGSATKVPAVVTYLAASKQAVIDPISDLQPSTEYTVSLRSGMKGANGLSVQGTPVIWTFTTAAPVPVAPQVISQSPSPGATGVAVGSSVTAGFDQDMNAGTLSTASFLLQKSGSIAAVPATVSYVGGTRTAVLDPSSDLEPSTQYSVTLTTAVKGANALSVQGAPVTWTFTTAAAEPSGPAFIDVPFSHAFYGAIQGMADLGIINGYPVGGGLSEFRPGSPVYRWQFGKMIVGALSLPIFESDTSPFTDLDPDTAGIDMTEFVAVAWKEGITNGTTATKFGPYLNISRTQVVTMVVRAVQSISPGVLATPGAGYANTWGTSYSSIHGPLARTAEYNGLLAGIDLSGVANSPWSPMPRGEVAQILWNMMDLMGLR